MPQRQWDSSNRSSSSHSRSSSSRSSSSWSGSRHRSSWDDDDDDHSSGSYSPEQIVIGLVILGAIIGGMLLIQAVRSGQEAARDRDATATTQAITEQDLAEMRAALQDDLPLWMELAETGKEYHVRPEVAGFGSRSNTKEVVYGRCETERFYVYVVMTLRPLGISADTQGYAYIPGSTPSVCHPKEWRIAGSVRADADWHFVAIDTYRATYAARTRIPAFTPTPTPAVF